MTKRTRKYGKANESIATLDVKLRAPNGTNVNVKGKQGFDGVTSGSVRHHFLSNNRPNVLIATTDRGQTHAQA